MEHTKENVELINKMINRMNHKHPEKDFIPYIMREGDTTTYKLLQMEGKHRKETLKCYSFENFYTFIKRIHDKMFDKEV